MPHSSLRPSQRLAPRCGQYWSMTPTRPRESRKASSSSPSTTIFFGSPSGSGSSSDNSTGSQKRRNSSPIGVPAPDSVRNLLSSARSMRASRILVLISGKLGAGAGARQCGLRTTAPAFRCVIGRAGSPWWKSNALWFDVGPALLLQLHHPHDAGLDDLCLRYDRDVLVLGLVHVLLGVAAGLERNLRRAQRHRLDPGLHRRGVLAQHVQAGAERDDLDFHFIPRTLVKLRDVHCIVE